MKIPTNWSFKSDAVASEFDKHVREQLPWYDIVTEILAHFITCYIGQGETVVDMGCSTGNLEVTMGNLIEARELNWLGFDNSQEMLDKYRGDSIPKLADIGSPGFVLPATADIVVSNLCLMFIPPERRINLLRMMRERSRDHVKLLLVDKFETHVSPDFDRALYKLALRFKMKTTPAQEILEKELSLSGVQFPMHEHELNHFGKAEQVFQVGNFKGFVCYK